tara:strand:+ start:27 stop:200 length:174 start_codon:yes stop_codon:yes gene_type:complete
MTNFSKKFCAKSPFKSILGSFARILPKGSLGNKTSGKDSKESNVDRILSGKKTNLTA